MNDWSALKCTRLPDSRLGVIDPRPASSHSRIEIKITDVHKAITYINSRNEVFRKHDTLKTVCESINNSTDLINLLYAYGVKLEGTSILLNTAMREKVELSSQSCWDFEDAHFMEVVRLRSYKQADTYGLNFCTEDKRKRHLQTILKDEIHYHHTAYIRDLEGIMSMKHNLLLGDHFSSSTLIKDIQHLTDRPWTENVYVAYIHQIYIEKLKRRNTQWLNDLFDLQRLADGINELHDEDLWFAQPEMIDRLTAEAFTDAINGEIDELYDEGEDTMWRGLFDVLCDGDHATHDRLIEGTLCDGEWIGEWVLKIGIENFWYVVYEFGGSDSNDMPVEGLAYWLHAAGENFYANVLTDEYAGELIEDLLQGKRSESGLPLVLHALSAITKTEP